MKRSISQMQRVALAWILTWKNWLKKKERKKRYFWEKWGHLNIGWILDGIKELFDFLHVTVIFWLHFRNLFLLVTFWSICWLNDITSSICFKRFQPRTSAGMVSRDIQKDSPKKQQKHWQNVSKSTFSVVQNLGNQLRVSSNLKNEYSRKSGWISLKVKGREERETRQIG